MGSVSRDCVWGRSASARSIGCCSTDSAGPSRARHCSVSMSGRAVIRSSRWSWLGFSTRASTRSSRFPFRRRSTSSSVAGSPYSPRRLATHVIEYENGTIRFTHPLLSSVLYRDLGEQRRTVHGRISGIVDDPIVRARHLALSTDAPDAEVAARLDDAATLAAEHGVSAVAAELAEHATRLTPPDARDARRRRAL